MVNSKKGKSKQVTYIILELVGSELFDYIFSSGRFTEPIARYYFVQILNTLQYMHQQGIAHRDLKPENMLFDNQFNIKIADFGFAASTAGRDGSGLLTTYLGSVPYMAPEIHLGKSYSGAGVDLFAVGIILFLILSGRPPFGQATVQDDGDKAKDPLYTLLAANRADLFFQSHA